MEGSQSFGEKYSRIYDLLYSDKDYKRECDFLEEIFIRFDVGVSRILDLGCGSGGHAVILSQRGYSVVGVDRSPHMIRKALEKLKDPKGCEFFVGDVRHFRTPERFDAVISMFAVASYQTENEDVISFFGTAYEHLRPGGVFVFDFWFGPAVLRERPQVRLKEVRCGDLRVVRVSEPRMDVLRSTVDVVFRVFVVERDDFEEFEEIHRMRFFFASELTFMLRSVGFSDVFFFPFLDLSREPGETDWNVLCVSFRK